MKTKVLFICMAAILFAGCGNNVIIPDDDPEPFTPFEVECQEIFGKWLSEYGETTPATAEIRIINSVEDYLPIEIEFKIGDAIVDTLKIPISDIDFTTQQIVVVIGERTIQGQDKAFAIRLNNVIEYENYIEISVQKLTSISTATGRGVMLILMPKITKIIEVQWNIG